MSLSCEDEEEREEERPDASSKDNSSCYATPQAEKPIKDAMSGQVLDRGLVAIARQKELKYFLAREVWLKRPRNEAYQVMGKRHISVKWVDVNKGDDLNPNYRSRPVARNIRLPGEEAVFAPTPPLDALRTVLSAAAADWNGAKKHIRDPESKYRTQISFIYVSRA